MTPVRLKIKCTFLITIFIFVFQISVYGNQSNNYEQFSENLEKLRNIDGDLSLQNDLLIDLIVNNPEFRGNLAIGFFISNVSEILSLYHVYILQLNTFDITIDKKTGQKALKIPKRSTDYCCWKNISLVHMQLSYETQEILKDEAILNMNFQSPHILYQVKSTLEKLRICLRYFDNYFANLK